MNTIELSACQTIREGIMFLISGTGAPPSARAKIATAVEELDVAVDAILAKQIWDPASPEHGNTHGKPVSHGEFTFAVPYFRPAEVMVKMWACPFSRHHQSAQLLERLIAALRFGERYTRPDKPRDGSWFSWDIWFPQVYSTMLLFLGDKMPADLRHLLIEDLERMPSKTFSMDRDHGITRPPLSPGFNNLEVLYTGFLRGVALHDAPWIKTAMSQVPVAMGRSPDGEGLQNDWSYHFHGHGVNTGYGLGALMQQAQWIYITQGTPWQIAGEVQEFQVGMVREFFARNMWRGRIAPYSTDRGIVTPDAIYARGFLPAVLLGYISGLPAKDHAVYAAAAADYLQTLEPDGSPTPHTEFRFRNGELITGLLLSKVELPIKADPQVLGGMRYYPDSEYLLVREPTWFTAARMSSGRISTWKSMLGYNLYGSSTAEFSIALMTDGREFDTTTIATMNWKRLMGVTRCDVIEPPPEGYGQSTFSSGLAGDDFAVMGLQYLLAPAGQDTLRANKSLFVTPQALVLLGTEIHCDSAEPVFTTLFHAPLINDGPYLRGGKPLPVEKDFTWDLKAGETLFLRNIGVHLLTDAQLIVETRRCSYAELNMPQVTANEPKNSPMLKVHERRWVYIIVNHGVEPTTGHYGAIICPGTTPAAMPPASAFKIQHDAGHHRVSIDNDATGGEVRFPGDWRKPIGSSYWGAEQHQWGSIARWSPGDDADHAQLEITPPRRHPRSAETNTEIFLPEGLEVENVTLKTYAGTPFPATILSLPAAGQVRKLRVRKVRR